jgi:hypothetical protein
MIEPKIFFVVGAQKAGTTALFDYLISYKEMNTPKRKELHELDKQQPISKSDFLKELGVDDGLTGDFSPSYLYSKYAAQNIFNYFPEAKIIIMLRNPMERAYSNMVHSVRVGLEPNIDLGALINDETTRLGKNAHYHYLSKGFYSDQVKRYLDLFGSKNVLILKYETFKTDSSNTLKTITEFLGIPFQENLKLTKRNTGHVATNKFSQLIVRYYSRLQRNGVAVNQILPENIRKKLKIILLKKDKGPTKDWFNNQNRLIFMEDIIKLENLTLMNFGDWYH